MNKLELIRHLATKNRSNKTPACKTVASSLGIDEGTIRAMVNSINSDGIYKISTGYGGGLKLDGGPVKEKDIYPFVEHHADKWVQLNIFGHRGVTAQKTNPTHKRKLDGKWSTPDFTLLCVHKSLHAPQNWIELVTIEVKHAEAQFNVACVYEALAHTRVATYSVLFFYDCPHNTIADRKLDKVLEEIRVECVRLGVGLVISQYPADLESWQYLIPAKKHEPDIRRIDAFIEEAFDKKDQDWLKKML